MAEPLTMRQNERRAFKLSFYDNNIKNSIKRAYYSVYDSNSNIVISEQQTYRNENYSTLIIGTIVTSTVGDYTILWKLIDENDYIFYHKISLKVI